MGILGCVEGVKKGFLERVTFKLRLMGGWDLAGPGGEGEGYRLRVWWI